MIERLSTRLSEAPVADNLATLSDEGGINPEGDEYLLGKNLDRWPFEHWSAHLRSFWGWYNDEPDYNPKPSELQDVIGTIAEGLRSKNYAIFADAIVRANSAENLNNLLIKQYTDETSFFREVNYLLRAAHRTGELTDLALVPWVLQFNCALRLQPDYTETVYRGTRMAAPDIAEYKVGRLFSWASYTSASKEIDYAISTKSNVIFSITPWGSYSMYDKRNSRDISALSIAPDEKEVVFPAGCTFRVTDISSEKRRTHISIETVDQY